MFDNVSKCKNCKAKLIQGPTVERSAQIKGFTCELAGIPTNICPNGCPGNYWYDLDFGVEVLELSPPDRPNMAKRRGLFRTRQYCPRCVIELVDSGQSSTFITEGKLRSGNDLRIKITAPSLYCPNCHSYYMPEQTSSADPYYSDLADVITAAITDDLIYK